MKKVIMALAVFIGFYLFQPPSTHAMTGGLLDGKPFSKSAGGVATKITDGDETTYDSLGYKSYTQFTFPIAANIESYFFKFGCGSGGCPNLLFLDESGNILYDSKEISGTKTVTLPSEIKNVKTVRINNKTGWAIPIYELDVFGSLDLAYPINVKVVPDVRSLMVSWYPCEGATGYNIYKDGLLLAHTTDTSYVINNLFPDVAASIRVSAVYDGVESRQSDPVVSAPYDDLQPLELSAKVGWNKITMSWVSPEGAKDFEIYINGKKVTTTNASSYVYNAEPEKEYEFYIVGADKYGRQITSNVIKLVTPVKPDDIDPPAKPNLAARMSEDYTSILLTWTANQEPDLAGYNLYVTPAGEAEKKLNTNLLKQTSYNFKNIVPEKRYDFRLEAVDQAGNISDPATVSITVPSRTTESEQEEKPDYLLVTWKPTAGAVGYLIYLNGRQVGAVGPDVFSFKITKEMGYRPDLSNVAIVKAKFADGSIGGGNNGSAPPLSSDGLGFEGADIWTNIVLLISSLGTFLLIGLVIKLTPRVLRIVRLAVQQRRSY